MTSWWPDVAALSGEGTVDEGGRGADQERLSRRHVGNDLNTSLAVTPSSMTC